MIKPWIPSNGTEGMQFVDDHCAHCIHEQFMHTQNDDHKKCEILTRSMVEVTPIDEWWCDYQNKKWGCDKYVNFDWGDNDDDDGIEPPNNPNDGIGPNQLVMPFEMEVWIGDKKIESLSKIEY